MGKTLRLLVGVALGATLVVPAFAATPTAVVTPAATPAPDAGQDRTRLRPTTGGEVHEDVVVFEGGVGIGRATDGAAKLTFVARGTCTLTVLMASTAINVAKTYSCAATGAAVGDFVLVKPRLDLQERNFTVTGAEVAAADTIRFMVGNIGTATPANIDVTFDYLVIR